MAKKVVKQSQPEKKKYCGECGHGVWIYDYDNLDVYNELPICLRCPFTPDRRRIRSEIACSNFKPKKPGELIVTPEKIIKP